MDCWRSLRDLYISTNLFFFFEQTALARLDALESDNVAMELVDGDDDEEASLDDEENGKDISIIS